MDKELREEILEALLRKSCHIGWDSDTTWENANKRTWENANKRFEAWYNSEQAKTAIKYILNYNSIKMEINKEKE